MAGSSKYFRAKLLKKVLIKNVHLYKNQVGSWMALIRQRRFLKSVLLVSKPPSHFYNIICISE